MLLYGRCAKCHKLGLQTKHHLLPKRHYGNGRKNDKVLILCRKCHDEIERLLPYEKKSKNFYIEVTSKFIGFSIQLQGISKTANPLPPQIIYFNNMKKRKFLDGEYNHHLKKIKKRATQWYRDNAVPFAILATSIFWILFWLYLIDQKCY